MERYELPGWFEIHMEMYPERGRDSEWVRLHRKGRDEYDLDDISSAMMIEGMRAVAEEYQARKKLTRFESDLREAVREINGNVIKLNPKN